ncbi:MAG: hypothetical protein ACJ8DC_20255 [Gemmatimonadales bacterium]
MRAGRLALAGLLLAGCSSSGAGGGPATPSPSPAPPRPGAVTPTAGGKGPAVTYRPARSLGYKLERHDSLTLQYPGGATQEQIRDRVAFFHLMVAESGNPGVYQVAIVLDSLQAAENGVPVPPDSLAAARGSRWTGTLTPYGDLSPLKADRAGTLTDEMTGRLQLLFPRLPSGGARDGMEWSDSTSYKLVADAFPGTEHVVNTYRASGASEGKGVTLQSTGSYSRSGTRLQGDQELQMSATGARHGVQQIGSDGVVVSSRGNDAGDMTITVPAVGQTVPVKQSGSYSIISTSSR